MHLSKEVKKVLKDWAYLMARMIYEDIQRKQQVADASKYLKENPMEIIAP